MPWHFETKIIIAAALFVKVDVVLSLVEQNLQLKMVNAFVSERFKRIFCQVLDGQTVRFKNRRSAKVHLGDPLLESLGGHLTRSLYDLVL